MNKDNFKRDQDGFIVLEPKNPSALQQLQELVSQEPMKEVLKDTMECKKSAKYVAVIFIYPDGMRYYVIYKTKNRKIIQEGYDVADKVNCKIKKFCQEHHGEVKTKKFNPQKNVGLLARSSKGSDKISGDYVRAFNHFLEGGKRNSGGQNARMLLAAGLLSGLIAQMIHDLDELNIPESRKRASVFSIAIAAGSGVGDFMQKATKSFCVNTACNAKRYKFVNPSYFPETGDSNQVADDAYIQFMDIQDHVLNKNIPSMYADTSVALNARFLSKKQVEEFLRRNPWCSTVVLGSAKGLTYDQIIRIDAKLLYPHDLDWNDRVLDNMSVNFARWLRSQYLDDTVSFRERLLAYVKTAGRCIDEYNLAVGKAKISKPDRFWHICQLTVILGLTDFLREIGQFDEASYILQRASWLNQMLPGCYAMPMSVQESPTGEVHIYSEQDFQKIFEQTICRMLSTESLDHYIYVPQKCKIDDVLPKGKDQMDFTGFLREYAQKDEKPQKTIMFTQQTFFTQFEACCTIPFKAEDIVNKLRNEKCSYFPVQDPKNRCSSFKFLDSHKSTVRSVVLLIKNLDFLDDNIRRHLLSQFY